MFTGIISTTGKVKKAEFKNGALYLTVSKPITWAARAGDSIAIDGICLTAKKVSKTTLDFELMPETIAKTNFSKQVFGEVNLERALTLKDGLSGHIVLGHIDTVGIIKSVKKAKEALVFTIQFPKEFASLVASKGSVAIDGISLTTIKPTSNQFSVSIVSYTQENTTLCQKGKGDVVNIEFDIVAKYLEKICKKM
ncbi:MAG: riboflavin synthase [Candidatus Harrisonbacteria bacterium CG10_big_fil_rev_8_21_14_0_10_45_28]|uniref:Riboflavin synthase n=1 Tax=Candidatus Harrisonbacteria bacterium CG10_big_fil_rev_8_21_14_0_10_45_28 TaxID=1974586 RepID=A0A2H0UPM8_9BACT|nr:MAG: riboflavin synthase [Candidatus Harrisonbacteria bacterium CG10_big_fil_rev_8_21_14_0_10_45_28]